MRAGAGVYAEEPVASWIKANPAPRGHAPRLTRQYRRREKKESLLDLLAGDMAMYSGEAAGERW